MENFNTLMQVHAPATESLSLYQLDEYIKRDYEGRLLLKTQPYNNTYVDINAMAENVQQLMYKIDTLHNGSHLQQTIESMADAINMLADENDKLKQRIEELEMLSKDN